jgi:hypothetical protein
MKTSLFFLLAITALGNFSFSSGLGFTTRTIVAKKSRREQLPTSSNLLQDVTDKDCCFYSPSGGMAIRGGAAEKKSRRGVDFVALLKYGIGFGVQMSLIYGLLFGVDRVVAKFALKIPFYAKCIFFYFFNIKTGAFSPLKGRREPSDDAEKKVKKKPKWTPPGYVFGVMWPLFVFGTRAATASMIVSASGGAFATSTIMSLMFHLGFGNLWNTV